MAPGAQMDGNDVDDKDNGSTAQLAASPESPLSRCFVLGKYQIIPVKDATGSDIPNSLNDIRYSRGAPSAKKTVAGTNSGIPGIVTPQQKLDSLDFR